MIRIEQHSVKYEMEVISLILEIQRNEYGIDITGDDQPDLKNIDEFYIRDGGNFWIAHCNETVAGTIAVKNIGGGAGALRKMFVKKEFRGRDTGVSAELLSTLKNWCRENGYSGIYLGTTEKFRAAHRFYEKNGFSEIGIEDLPESFPVMSVDRKFYKISLSELTD